jgi:hypothetical protein
MVDERLEGERTYVSRFGDGDKCPSQIMRAYFNTCGRGDTL